MMKLKSNQTRTYDGDGYKKRAACLCFRSESEEEVRRRPGVAGVGGRGETRRGGAAVRGRCAGAAGRASRLGLNEVLTEFPSAKMREKGKGRWAEGSGSESGRSAPAGPGHFGAGCLSFGSGAAGRRRWVGKSVWLSVLASSFGSRKGSSALVSPAHVWRGRRARGAGRPFVAETQSTVRAALGFTEGFCVSVRPRRAGFRKI